MKPSASINTGGYLPLGLAMKVGSAPLQEGEEGPLPNSKLDWALHYAAVGLHVFPCEGFIGNPLVEKWHHSATTSRSQIAEWWSLHSDADIACVLDKSDHFAMLATGLTGTMNLQDLEDEFGELKPVFEFRSAWGNRFLIFKGHAYSSREKLAPGVFVLGTGQYIFLPPSRARIVEEAPANERTIHWENE